MTTTAETARIGALTARSFKAIGTTATVVVQDADMADVAGDVLRADLDELDAACSRFRADSELEALHAHAGRPFPVSALLFEVLELSCDVARRSGGAVDPTVGNAIAALGYDADIDLVRSRPASPSRALGDVAGYGHIQMDADRRSVRIPRGVRLDLGSTAKAFGADRSARRIADIAGSGALVSLGGDVAVAGPPPPGGWAVGIAPESASPPGDLHQVVAIAHGGLASSAINARTWTSGARRVHHIVNPETGDSVDPYWTLVSATGRSCVEANLVTTASIVWGAAALERLRAYEQPVRLVRVDGAVFSVNGWPPEAAP